LIAFAVALLGVVRAVLAGEVGFLAFTLAFIGIGGAVLIASRENVSIFVNQQHVGMTNVWGRRKEYPLQHAQAMQFIGILLSSRPQPIPAVLILNEEDRCLFWVTRADLFPISELKLIASAAGMDVRGSFDQIHTLRELSRRYPGCLPGWAGALTWILDHPTIRRLVVIIATVIAVAVVLYVKTKH
jgi:hypothetical protein